MKLYIFDSDKEHLSALTELVETEFSYDLDYFCNERHAVLYESLQKDEPVVVLLDTRMRFSGGNSFTFAQKIRARSESCHIVFMAPTLGDLPFCLKKLIRPSGFLLKPVEEDELTTLINAIIEAQRNQNRADADKAPHMTILSDGVRLLLKISEILCFTTRGKKLVCCMQDGREIEFYGTMRQMEATHTSRFLRCHSGYLVNKARITAVSRGGTALQIAGLSYDVPVSKKHKSAVLAYMRGDTNSNYQENNSNVGQ